MDKRSGICRLLRASPDKWHFKHSKRNRSWSDAIHAPARSWKFQGPKLPWVGDKVSLFLVLLWDRSEFGFSFLLHFSVSLILHLLFHDQCWLRLLDSFLLALSVGIESFSKLGDSIYFEEEGEVPGLYIIQYISSSLDWKSGQVVLNQKVDTVVSWDPYLRITLTFSPKKVFFSYQLTQVDILFMSNTS